MKSIKINLLVIFAIVNSIILVQSVPSAWQRTANVWNDCVGQTCTQEYVANRFWTYSNIAYCSERSIDAMDCAPCQQANQDKDDFSKSWTHNGALAFVFYDKILNKVVVTFRGTEGMMALNNWRTNLDFVSTVVQCVPLKARRKVYQRLAKKNLKSKNKAGLWPFSEIYNGVKNVAQGAKNYLVGGYHLTEHLAQLVVGTPLQFVKQKVGNTYTRLTKDDYSCFMHHGFWGNADGLMKKKIFIQTKWYTIEDYINELYVLKRANGVSFTGHSLGGAMATVAASSFLYKQIKERNLGKTPAIKVASLYTYGSPQVGDINFAKWFDESTKALGVKNYRFRYQNDAVTHSLGFTHIGNLVRCTAAVAPSTKQVCFDCGQWSTATQTAGEYDMDPKCQLGNLASLSIPDHSDYFKTEVLVGKKTVKKNNKDVEIDEFKCDMREDQDSADDAVYQREKSAKELAEAQKLGLASTGRFKKKHYRFIAKRRQHHLRN